MGRIRKILWCVPILFFLAAFMFPLVIQPADSISFAQGTFPTPTPDADGNIIYIVQAGDSPWTIAAVAGISIEELYALNGMRQDDFITPGMELLLGNAPLPTETPLPEAQLTETAMAIPPTPVFGVGDICVLIFEDVNGNGRLDDNESALSEGRISVISVGGTLVGEHTTDANPDGYCFENVEFGDYNVSAAIPENYNATTTMNLAVTLQPGDTNYIQFGAQASGVIDLPDNVSGGQRSLVLGILGVVMLLAAGGIGFYAYRFSR